MMLSGVILGVSCCLSGVLSRCIPCEEGREWPLRLRCGEEHWCQAERLLPLAVDWAVDCYRRQEFIAATIAELRGAFLQFRLFQRDLGAYYGLYRTSCPFTEFIPQGCRPEVVFSVAAEIRNDIAELNALWRYFRHEGRGCSRSCERLASEIFELLQAISCRLIYLKRLVLACAGDCRIFWAMKSEDSTEFADLLAEFDDANADDVIDAEVEAQDNEVKAQDAEVAQAEVQQVAEPLAN